MDNSKGAFPATWWDKDSLGETVPRETYPGMSLREYYAGKMMAALITKRETDKEFYPVPLSIDAVRLADALIKGLNDG